MSNTLKRLRGSVRHPKATFHVTVTDAAVDFSPGYQPNNVYLGLSRHAKESTSESVKWEASLKSPLSGLCLWHPPFVASVEISLPVLEAKIKEGSEVHKDVFLSLWTTKGSKGSKVKLLARARIDLYGYRETAVPENVKLRLLPETKKVTKCSVNLTIVNGTKRAREDTTVNAMNLLIPGSRSNSQKSLDLLAGSEGPQSLSKSLHSLDPLERSLGSTLESDRSSFRSRKSVDLNLGPFSRTSDRASDRARSVENLDRKTQGSQGTTDVSRESTPPPLPPPRKCVAPYVPVKQEVKQEEPVVTRASHNEPPPATNEVPFNPAYTPKTPTSPTPPSMPVPSPPSERPKISLEDSFKDDEDGPRTPPQPKQLFSLSTRPTPLADTPGKIQSRMSMRDNDLLKWAKQVLKKYSTIKVTNLSSSWRNGMGFCALIHSKYPELINFKKLNGQQAEDNTRLAQRAAQLLGIECSDLQECSIKTNSKFLNDLKPLLETPKKLTDEEKASWKQTLEYLEKHKIRPESSVISLPPSDLYPPLFSSRPGPGGQGDKGDSNGNGEVKEQELVEPVITDDAKEQVEPARSEVVPEPEKSDKKPDEAAPEPSQHPESTSSPSGSKNGSPSKFTSPDSSVSDNKKRVQEMIMNAHRSLSMQSDEDIKDASLLQIQEERKKLDSQADHFAMEQTRLENLLRTTDEPSAMESLIIVVNAKNDLVRRQMQLNILEKDAILKSKQEKIQDELQQIADIDPDRKTETIKNRELQLINQHLELVNERNELVHHLDTQEQAIVEDENIRESLRTGTQEPDRPAEKARKWISELLR